MFGAIPLSLSYVHCIIGLHSGRTYSNMWTCCGIFSLALLISIFKKTASEIVSYHWETILQEMIIFIYLKISFWCVIKTEKNKAKISVNKAEAMHATRKDAATTWMKEAVPECQDILKGTLVVKICLLILIQCWRVKLGSMITYLPLSVHLFMMLKKWAVSASLFFHTGLWSLSTGNIFSQVFWGMKYKASFHDCGNSKDCLNYFNWIVQVVYLSNVFHILKRLNISIQGLNITILWYQDFLYDLNVIQMVQSLSLM